jgi:hypothetical protein
MSCNKYFRLTLVVFMFFPYGNFSEHMRDASCCVAQSKLVDNICMPPTLVTAGFARHNQEADMIVLKGLLAAAVAGLGVFAVVATDGDATAAPSTQTAAHYPPTGLPGLLRPLEH